MSARVIFPKHQAGVETSKLALVSLALSTMSLAFALVAFLFIDLEDARLDAFFYTYDLSCVLGFCLLGVFGVLLGVVSRVRISRSQGFCVGSEHSIMGICLGEPSLLYILLVLFADSTRERHVEAFLDRFCHLFYGPPFGITPVIAGYVAGRYLPIWIRIIPAIWIFLEGYWAWKWSAHGFNVYVTTVALYTILCVLGLWNRSRTKGVGFWSQYHLDWMLVAGATFMFWLTYEKPMC